MKYSIEKLTMRTVAPLLKMAEYLVHLVEKRKAGFEFPGQEKIRRSFVS